MAYSSESIVYTGTSKDMGNSIWMQLQKGITSYDNPGLSLELCMLHVMMPSRCETPNCALLLNCVLFWQGKYAVEKVQIEP